MPVWAGSHQNQLCGMYKESENLERLAHAQFELNLLIVLIPHVLWIVHANSVDSDQPAHMRRLIRVCAV